MFTLSISTNNAAFAGPEGPDLDAAADEVCRILRLVANDLEGGIRDGATRDLNGNVVGAFRLRIRR